jgi:short subunit dehydrogenase-like uncharacterized protein
MFTNKPWMLYGATGRTGTLIAERAAALGHRPLLAGRDAERLRPLAERLGLPWVAAAADDLYRVLGASRLVLLAAGPFESTSRAVLDACLRAEVHYLDIANEIGVIERVLDVRTERITALPAVGFGTVASDGLARHVADQVPGADRLELAILLGTAGSSAGARASAMAALAGGGRVRRDGRLVRTRLGSGARSLATPVGVRTVVPVPTGDLVTAYHTTGIPNVSVAMTMPMPVAAARLLLPALPALARAARHLPGRGRRIVPASDAPAPATRSAASPVAVPDQTGLESYVWARATAPDGRSAQGWLRTGEGYLYTANSAVATVEAVLASEPIGATTVAAAFGSEIALAAGGDLLAAA